MFAALLSPIVDYYNDEEELDSVDDEDERSVRCRDSDEGDLRGRGGGRRRLLLLPDSGPRVLRRAGRLLPAGDRETGDGLPRRAGDYLLSGRQAPSALLGQWAMDWSDVEHAAPTDCCEDTEDASETDIANKQDDEDYLEVKEQ
ncbi:uncharacterized protein LOC144605799 [Rhinoraja longicauda]